MPKYTTGRGNGGGGGDSCELCGRETDDLTTATVAGARLEVCQNCAPHSEESESGGEEESDERRRRAARNAARMSDSARGDSRHWEEEGTNYDSDQLPYLVRDYGERVERARQEAGLQRDELADELGIDENDLLAVEQERATQAGVGGSVIRALEERLDVSLAEE